MPIIDSSLSTLEEIIITVRRLTNRPSTSQITDDEIKKYVNKFILYDFPAVMNALPLRKTLTFYLDAYIQTYGNNTTDPDDPLYNFKNKYLTINSPVYVAGQQMAYFEDREIFNAQYQPPMSITQIATGTGVLVPYTGTLTNIPVQRGMVLFSSVDTTEEGVALIDRPLNIAHTAELIRPDTAVAYGVFDYVSGYYGFTFPLAPKVGAAINAQVVPYNPTLPTAVLFYNNTFSFYPIPDQPYQVSVEVLQRPTEFLVTTDEPEYDQWAEFIAYGASIKILQQSRDPESANELMQEFRRQEVITRRKAIAQQTDYKTPTIYDGSVPFVDGTGWWFIP